MLPSAIKTIVILCLCCLLAKTSESKLPSDDTWDSQYKGSFYKDTYDVVNVYLIENVASSESMQANMEALQRKLNSGDTKKIEKTVLAKLVALSTLANECSKISYEAIQDSDEATGYKSYDVSSKRAAPRRINKLINYYGVQHASTCQAKLERLFKPKMKLLDRQVLNRLATWLDPVIDRILAKSEGPKSAEQTGTDAFSSKVYHAIIKQNSRDPTVDNVKLAYNALKTLVKDQPDDEMYLHYISNEVTGFRRFSRSDVKSRLFDRYIYDSCDSYREQMGDLFETLNYDSKFHHELKPDQPNLYRAWAYWKICHDAFVKPSDKAYYWSYSTWPLPRLQDYAEKIANKEEMEEEMEMEKEDDEEEEKEEEEEEEEEMAED